MCPFKRKLLSSTVYHAIQGGSVDEILNYTLETKLQVHCPNLSALFTNFRCVALFIILYKVVLPFEFVDEILM